MAGADDPTPVRRFAADPPLALRAQSGLEPMADAVLSLWPRLAPQVAAGVGLAQPRVLEVVLLHGDTFRAWASGLVPEWGIGFANWPDGPIVLDAAGATRGPKDLAAILRHELSHVYVGQRVGGAPLPRWLVEGIAQEQAGEERFTDAVALARAAALGRLPQLAELADGFPAGGGAAELAYAVSLRAVEELDRRLAGRGGWRALLAAVPAAGAFEPAFTLTTGMDVASFELQLGERLRGRYGWIALIGSLSSVFTLMTVLFLAATARAYLLRRRRLEQMERAEQTEQMGRAEQTEQTQQTVETQPTGPTQATQPTEQIEPAEPPEQDDPLAQRPSLDERSGRGGPAGP